MKLLLQGIFRYSFCLLALFELFLSGTSSIAQRVRFTDASNKWNHPMCDWSSGPPVAFWYDSDSEYQGDTIISGRKYQFLTGFLVREDTVAGRVYFRITSAPDTVEHLLYDYNLQPGDTLKIDYHNFHRSYPILALDSVQMGGEYYKRWKIPIPNFGIPIYLIEGIGSSWGPLYILFSGNFERAYQLRCFTNRGRWMSCVPSTALYTTGSMSPAPFRQPIPLDSFDNSQSCMSYFLEPTGVAGSPTKTKPLVLPNPGGLEAILTVPESIISYRLTVLDVTGRIVACVQAASSRHQPVGRLVPGPGTYLYSIETESGERVSGKFVIW